MSPAVRCIHCECSSSMNDLHRIREGLLTEALLLQIAAVRTRRAISALDTCQSKLRGKYHGRLEKQRTSEIDPHSTGLEQSIYVAQEVNHVVGHVDEEQGHNSVKLSVLREHFQEIALDQLDGRVWHVVRNSDLRIAR